MGFFYLMVSGIFNCNQRTAVIYKMIVESDKELIADDSSAINLIERVCNKSHLYFLTILNDK